MLIYDKELFEVKDNSSEYFRFEDDNEILTELKEIYEDLDDLDKYEEFHDNLIHQYELVAKKDMILGNDFYTVFIKKGDAVLKGNGFLFYGKKDCHFENSYFSDKVIVNLIDPNGEFNAINSIIKDNIDLIDNTALRIGYSFSAKDSNLLFNIIEFPIVEEDFGMQVFIMDNFSSENSDVMLSQNIAEYEVGNNLSFAIKEVKCNPKVLFDPYSMGEIDFDGPINLNMKNVYFNPSITISFEINGSLDSSSVLGELSNIEIMGEIDQGRNNIVFTANEVYVKDVNFHTSMKTFNIVKSELIDIKGEHVLKTDDRFLLNLKNSDGNYHIPFFMCTKNFQIKGCSNSSLTLECQAYSIKKEKEGISFCCEKDTNTIVDLKFLESSTIDDIKNNSLGEMVIKNSRLLSAESIKVEDSSISGSLITLGDSQDRLNIRGSRISDSTLYFSNQNNEIFSGEIINSNVSFDNNSFNEGSYLKIQDNDVNKKEIKISNTLFEKDSITKIEVNSEKMEIDGVTMKGENLIVGVTEITNSEIQESKISNVDRFKDSKVFRCSFENIKSVTGLFEKEKIFVFNSKTSNLEGSRTENNLKTLGCSNTSSIANYDIDF